MTKDSVTHDIITTDKVPLNRSRTGYGSKIPTQYKVRDGKRFYRIYAKCYSNVAVLYYIKQKQRFTVEIFN